MVTLITDRHLEKKLIKRRQASGASRHDEVWDGVYIMNAMPNIEHQTLVGRLSYILQVLFDDQKLGLVLPGCNVTDRAKGWRKNYRVPDVAAFLNGTSAIPKDDYWFGGPDLAIEVVSPDDRSRKKLGFYAAVKTRELLLLNRNPWSLELYRLGDDSMQLVGASTVDLPDVLTTEVVPLTWRIVNGVDRPMVEAARLDGSQSWQA